MKRKATEEPVEEDPQERLKRIKKGYRNKQHTLIFSSRGISYRWRHLMTDLRELLPHSKSDVKFSDKANLYEINEVCEMKGCTNCIFFECRKKKDLYIWMAKTPSGPSVKLHATNVHTMSELKFNGNCLRGSRPILSFDKGFDETPHYLLMKELFSQIFGTPKMHPKSKPFIDHVLSFSIVDGRIWVRNYQIIEEADRKSALEIGPRFVMNPIKILSGGFSGACMWENPAWVSPNYIRASERRRRESGYAERKEREAERDERKEARQVGPDILDDVFAPAFPRGDTRDVEEDAEDDSN